MSPTTRLQLIILISPSFLFRCVCIFNNIPNAELSMVSVLRISIIIFRADSASLLLYAFLNSCSNEKLKSPSILIVYTLSLSSNVVLTVIISPRLKYYYALSASAYFFFDMDVFLHVINWSNI